MAINALSLQLCGCIDGVNVSSKSEATSGNSSVTLGFQKHESHAELYTQLCAGSPGFMKLFSDGRSSLQEPPSAHIVLQCNLPLILLPKIGSIAQPHKHFPPLNVSKRKRGRKSHLTHSNCFPLWNTLDRKPLASSAACCSQSINVSATYSFAESFLPPRSSHLVHPTKVPFWYVCVFTWVHASVSVCICVCVFMYMCVGVHMYLCVHSMYMYACVCMWAYVCVYKHI